MKKTLLAVFAILGLLFIIGSPCALAADHNTAVSAKPVVYTISINEQNYAIQAYTINGSDYFRLRDIAFIMIGTTGQFQVEWNETEQSVQITQGKYYREIGGELSLSETAKTAVPTISAIYSDGHKTDLTGYNIDGSTYLTIADMAKDIGFSADVDTTADTVVISGSPPENYENPDAFVLTLLADSSEALLNGNPVTLSEQPFIKNGTFYIPLKAITELLGGTYSFEDNRATIVLFGITTEYEIGSHTIAVNGETYEVSGNRSYFSTSNDSVAVDDNFVPVIMDGTVFIPDGFRGVYCPVSNALMNTREYPQSRMVILGGFENEQGINEVKLLNTYDLLPADFRTQFNYTGVVDEVINYSIEEYRNDDLELYVMRINPGYDDVELMDGRVCAIRVFGSQYCTPRGLRVDDSPYRAWLLYGYDHLSYSFSYN
ncbi:MAG: stalk domain-containing protein, partial [Oscillospiraceae bacterium]